jgi:hypothetical protein
MTLSTSVFSAEAKNNDFSLQGKMPIEHIRQTLTHRENLPGT